jgi:hypothetical protein
LSEDEDWEHPYPEGSTGWKINRKIDAIEEHALKSGAVFMFLFVVFLVPAVVEIVIYANTFPYPTSPFFLWRLAHDGFMLAQWNMLLYVVSLLTFAGAFFYFAVRLLWRGLKMRKS